MTDNTLAMLPAAGDRSPAAYDRTPTYERMIAQNDVAVPMRDGVNLSIDIYRPDSAERFPALLAFSIYNKDLQGPKVAVSLPPQPAWSSLWAGLLEAGDTKFFVSRGYVHVIGSPRGIFKSDGGGSRQ
jgi:predicted acyl esterase